MTESAVDPTGVAASPDGLAQVEAVVGDLAELDHLPVAEHVERFERAHDVLRSALTSSDGATVGAAG